MSRRHSTQRHYRQTAKHGHIHAVVEVTAHPTLATPFVAFIYNGASMRAELLESDIKLHGMANGLIGAESRPLAPDDWPDQVCAYMAKRALIEGKTA